MSERVAFITGAGSGMARLYAQRLLSQGWSVAALDVDAAGLDVLGDHPKLLKQVVDVRDEQAVVKAVEQTHGELGDITRVVNAAAIMPFAPLMETESETVRRIFDINFIGLVHVSKATVPGMIRRGRGDLIIFGSLSGHIPIFNMGAYGAAKFATSSYAETLQQETRGKGVHVMCVCPPSVKTPLLEKARLAHWPKLLDLLPAVTPETVIDAVEAGLAKKKFWVFPGWYTRTSIWTRRLAPEFLWWCVRMVERP